MQGSGLVYPQIDSNSSEESLMVKGSEKRWMVMKGSGSDEGIHIYCLQWNQTWHGE